MSSEFETLEKARKRVGGVKTTSVNLKKLQADFATFHEANGYSSRYTGDAWGKFVHLTSQLIFEGHSFKYDPRDGKWYAERIAFFGTWEEVNLNEYFFFMGKQ